ncbi:[protein-PII] uridylyltransferase [Roseospira marina]|uniref:Bifunctional uridylyltransferase/uridylyl-removing enzyme n=1 Tax=Roseospira marina TaxID=140057 RepID=A0A5M6IGD2_9PROT|nr:[protein-PII] uridylyltransferase [Roseospira marina]KAA5606735.1 [protein-PII] uridylyltransferase [Roseospira marina]MBB4313847.1 [protein-PII] uridylyltransferase [Roseospira marina]MBB5087009.1 [protein-PII] uridylyltransferase [Roseospira marina]
MPLPKPRTIINRKALIARLDDLTVTNRDGGRPAGPQARAALLGELRTALAEGREEIRRRFLDEGCRGAEVCAANTYLMDQIIRVLHDYTVTHLFPRQNRTKGERLCVLALGGYGRGEMLPFSDVDLMFLLPFKATPYTEQVVETILYVLWDMGLKVGHSTRSVDECIKQARADMTIRTSLLEARYLLGERALFQEMTHRLYVRVIAGSGPEFLDSKMAERDQRHTRMGDSRYVLEPNIKEGKGGLRDLHTLFWIARYLYSVSDMNELIGLGVLTPRSARKFAKARAFLWSVRAHLHYLSGRAEERLTFDVQPRIAERMNYTDRPGARGVERFMRHYFLVARDVGNLTRILLSVLEAQQKRRPMLSVPSFILRRRDLEGFVLDGQRLAVPQPDTFANDPLAMLRIFLVAHEQSLDIHPDTLRLITDNLARVKGLRSDPEANALFMALLTHRKEPDTILRLMSEAGVVGRFIPEFERVTAQMQYDMYHVYTTDEHTIRAIGILHRIETGALSDQLPVATEVIHKVSSRRALYVAVLLHDIAKGRGGDHSELGAEVAQELCPRLGLTDEETETVAWLVLHHLAMSRIAFKRDVDDRKTIEDFAELVQSPERLLLLAVLTSADIMAVGPGIWNNWKGGLLRDLYRRTEEFLVGDMVPEPQDCRVGARKDQLRGALSDCPADRVEDYLGRGYPGYWLSFDTETQARHARLIFAAEDSGETPDAIVMVDAQVDPARGVTEILVYAPDHPGLFSKIAGGIALAGGSILNARIFTLANSMALDTFTVQTAEGGVLDSPSRLDRVKAVVTEAVRGGIDLRAELARKSRTLPARARAFPVPPRVIIHEVASKTHTVVEVNGRDRPGFLFAVTDALTGLNLQIASARVNTYGERVVDVFYLKDVFGMKVTHHGKLRELKRTLTLAAGVQALESEKGAAVARQHGRAARRRAEKADDAERAAE